MQIEVIAARSAPAAIGPFSHAVKAGYVVYTSGQIGIDPATGKMVQGDFAAETRRMFENMKAILEAAGGGFRNVVKTNAYLTDLANFEQFNAIYTEYFGGHKPARSTVGVAMLVRGARVEIDTIAVL